MKRINNFFDQIAENYASTVALFNGLDDWVYIRNFPRKRNRVLEIGCGPGNLLSSMDKYFDKTYGIDSSVKMIGLAKSKNKNANLVHGDAHHLPYPDNHFDCVVSHATFHYLKREDALSEAVRVLNMGGRLIMAEVVIEPNLISRKVEKVALRYLWSLPRLVYKHGINKTIEILKYLGGKEWVESTKKARKQLFTKKKLKRFYSSYLPGATFGTARYKIVYFVWIKS